MTYFLPQITARSALQCAALALFLSVSGLTASASERQVIPFKVDSNGRMVVSLEVNETAQAVGVIDTAATYAMIDSDTAEAAGVPLPDEKTVSVLGLEGPQLYPVVQIKSLTTGNTRLDTVVAALNRRIKVVGVDNIVPVNALEGDVVDFDFDAERVLVYSGRPDTSTTLTTSRMPMRQINGLWFADVKMNGVTGLALIDTGSSISYVNSRFADDAGAKPNIEKTQILQGVSGKGIPVRVATARKFTLGAHRVSGPDLIVADPPLFAHLGLAEKPAMVLGLDYLSIFRVQLDRRRGYLVLGIGGGDNASRSIQMNARGTRIRTD